jgi:anti-sigma factor (TIGR02949 family)
MITCSEAVRQLWEYLEDELPARDREKIDEHLGACLRCCGEAEFAQELRKLLATHADAEGIPDSVRQRLLSTLDSLPEAP